MTFDIGKARCAVPCDLVVQIVAAVAVAPVPEAAELVVGVFNVRGRVVPLLDVGRFFGAPPRPVDVREHFIIVRAHERQIALRTERVVEVLAIPDEHIDATPYATANTPTPTMVALPDGLLLLVDPERLLTQAEAVSLAELAEVGE